MPTTGLLIMLNDAQQHADEGILQLASDTRFTLGDRIEHTLQPAVLDTKTAKEAREATDFARSLQGILEIHVVSVDFQDNDLPLTLGKNGSTHD